MNFASNLSNKIKKFITDLSPSEKEEIREQRPFLIVVSIILVVFSFFIALNSAQLKTPLFLIGFISIMLIHVSLHWLLGFVIKNFRWSFTYLIIQGLLGMSATLISGSPELALGIFAAMIGETIGAFGNTRIGWSAVIGYVIAAPITYLLIGGVEAFNNLMPTTLSVMVLLIVLMVLFRRQLDSGEKAKAVAEELKSANLQLMKYASQVEDLTRAAERRRMARDLHDTLAQGISGLVMQLEAMKAHLTAGREEKALEIISLALERARSTLASSRAAIDDLRAIPESLQEAMSEKIERFTEVTGIPCEINLGFSEGTLSQGANEQLIYTLNEALANITRHAMASHVWVHINVNSKVLELEIRDDGIGFDLDSLTRAGHYGLVGLRERARIIGGTLDIQTTVGQGTSIQMQLPAKHAYVSKAGAS